MGWLDKTLKQESTQADRVVSAVVNPEELGALDGIVSRLSAKYDELVAKAIFEGAPSHANCVERENVLKCQINEEYNAESFRVTGRIEQNGDDNIAVRRRIMNRQLEARNGHLYGRFCKALSSVVHPSAHNHGTSQYLTGGLNLIAEAEYYDFTPSSCVCLSMFNSSYQQGRTYMRVWDNRMEYNFPLAPFACCTNSELCVIDQIVTTYFDRPPFRSGMLCWIIPCDCYGPPVIFIEKPTCLCLDLSPYFGQLLMQSSANCFNCKIWLCCGGPCYKHCAVPMSCGIKNGEFLINRYKQAVDSYRIKHNISKREVAVFHILGTNSTEKTTTEHGRGTAKVTPACQDLDNIAMKAHR